MDTAILKQLALGAVPPAVAACAAVWMIWRGTAHGDGLATPPRGRARATVATLVVISLAMHPVLFGWPAIPPRAADQWLPVVAVLAGLAGLASMIGAKGAWAAAVGAAVAAAAGGALSARRLIASSWTPTEALVHLGLLLIGAALAAAATERLVRDRRGWFGPALLVIVAGGASQVLVLGMASLKVGQAAGVIAAVAGGLLVAAWFRPALWARGTTTAATTFVAVAIFQGALFGDAEGGVRWLYAGLVAIAPVLAAAVDAALPARLEGWKRSVLVLVAAGLPIGAALARAAVAMAAQQAAESY